MAAKSSMPVDQTRAWSTEIGSRRLTRSIYCCAMLEARLHWSGWRCLHPEQLCIAFEQPKIPGHHDEDIRGRGLDLIHVTTREGLPGCARTSAAPRRAGPFQERVGTVTYSGESYSMQTTRAIRNVLDSSPDGGPVDHVLLGETVSLRRPAGGVTDPNDIIDHVLQTVLGFNVRTVGLPRHGAQGVVIVGPA